LLQPELFSSCLPALHVYICLFQSVEHKHDYCFSFELDVCSLHKRRPEGQHWCNCCVYTIEQCERRKAGNLEGIRDVVRWSQRCQYQFSTYKSKVQVSYAPEQQQLSLTGSDWSQYKL
jgi:hypothetical protein